VKGAPILLPRRTSLRILIVIALAAFDAVLYVVLYRRFTVNARPALVFHIIAGGLLLGWRGGLISGLGTAPLAAWLGWLMGPEAFANIGPSGLIAGSVATSLIGTTIGAGADLARRLREEIEQRKQMQRELLESERRRLEAKMEAQFLRASRLASLGTLAAGVAHEINNPLAYLTSNLRSIRTALRAPEPPSPEEMRDLHDALDESIEGAERIEAIVKAIRVFSPRPAEESEEALDVRAVAAEALGMVEGRLRDRATAECRFEGEPRVVGNSERLYQALVNLLVNAAEAIPEGRPEEHRVTVTGRTQGDRVAIEISDTGAGIQPDVLPRIFEPFFSTKSPQSGTGLGLFVCKGIVSAMGGNLSVRTEPGKGSTFSIDLPSAGDQAPAPGAFLG